MTDDPFRSRWRRRSRTIPLMFAATTIGLLVSPLLVAVAAIADLLRGRRRLPTVRVLLFVLQYGINDSVEILLAPVYWIAAGFGSRLNQPASIERHRGLQRWSIDLLARRAERLLGLRFELEPGAVDALLPAPGIVLCRHVNIVDASLPTLLYQRLGQPTRGVIMAEMLADPGFDLIYARTGSVFIARDNGPDALNAVRGLGTTDANSATVIFPEGRLFRSDRLDASPRTSPGREPRPRRTVGEGATRPPAAVRVVSLRCSRRSPAMSWSSPTPVSTATRASLNSPKPPRLRTPSESSPGGSGEPTSPTATTNASHGLTSNGAPWTTGSPPSSHTMAPERQRRLSPRSSSSSAARHPASPGEPAGMLRWVSTTRVRSPTSVNSLQTSVGVEPHADPSAAADSHRSLDRFTAGAGYELSFTLRSSPLLTCSLSECRSTRRPLGCSAASSKSEVGGIGSVGSLVRGWTAATFLVIMAASRDDLGSSDRSVGGVVGRIVHE